MFCPSCGAEYTIELKYCNRCGANLISEIAPTYEPVVINLTKPTLLIGATLVTLTLGGFGALVGGATALAPFVHGGDPLIAMIFMGMLTIMVIDIFLVRQLSKLISASLSSGKQNQPQRPKLSANPPMAQLPQPSTARIQGVPSVTEGTTRFFEPALTPSRADDRATAERLESKLDR